MKPLFFVILILLFLIELSIADTMWNLDATCFIIYIVLLLLTLLGVYKTRPKDE